MEKIANMIIIAKALQLKPVRIIDILKWNVLNLTVMADKTLLKIIEIITSNCFIYMPKVIKLFFKSFLLFFVKPY